MPSENHCGCGVLVLGPHFIRQIEFSYSLPSFDATARLSLLYEVGTGPPQDRVRRPGAAIFMAHFLGSGCRTLCAVIRTSSLRDIVPQRETYRVAKMLMLPLRSRATN
jgi:hypothetical protein